jgi:hypothetical protein
MAQPTWNTPAGLLGSYLAQIEMTPVIQLSANSGIVNPLVTYSVISGNLPSGLTMSSSGVIFGTPNIVSNVTDYMFVVRAKNANNEVRDRTFILTISGSASPTFSTPSGSLFATNDSVWIERAVPYTNPISSNPVRFSLIQGQLPIGLEINEYGIIRGYPEKPLEFVAFTQIFSIIIATNASNNSITCASTLNFVFGRPIIFTGTLFGDLTAGKTYYVREVLNNSDFTISSTQYGPEVYVSTATGFATATLPDTVVGQPTVRTYTFDLLLESPLGQDIKSYYITVINQNLPQSQGGPGLPLFTRLPVILNTRPQTFIIPTNDPYYAYYLLPEGSNGNTYNTNQFALMGDFESDNYLAFKIIGYTFDNYEIKYQFVGLPTGLVGDEDTGWIYGTPILNTDNIGQYSFTVRVYKQSNPAIQSGLFNFSLKIFKNITSTVVWLTPESLGSIYNTLVSTKYVRATADVPLEYRLVSGSLPPNLTLDLDGEIAGSVANQPTQELLPQGTTTVYNFAIQAYSSEFPIINSTKNFTLSVIQQFDVPMDTLYIKATPSIENRLLIDSLLTNESIIPNQYLYRPDDINFGKATNVIYEHQYGVIASDIEKYLVAVERSHYWRNITLGSIKTAIARDENNNIIYEVVYSQVIDNLVNLQGESVNFDIVWPEPVNLNLGPWLTSVTNIYSSYTTANQENFYTSLTPGQAIVLYPNSLLNMNKQIADAIGQQYDSRILPLWMTSQQEDGNTLGFTRAWVICYTKPGFAKIVKNNIETLWKNNFGETNKLNQINFTLDRFSVDKSLTYNYDNYFTPPAWTGLPSGTPVPDPKNSKDFYVLFPRKTILPDQTQL